jgi:broad specificity phosphatase PhoE
MKYCKSNQTEHIITLFGLIRHGRTFWNDEKRIQGQADSPLTPQGAGHIAIWAERLVPGGWDRILASDLGRARQTADIINELLRIPLSYDSDLREQDWGQWTGRLLPEIETQARDQLRGDVSSGWHFRPPGGEDRNSVVTRGKKALARAVERWPGRRILVITHGGLIKCLTYWLLERLFMPGEPAVLKPYWLHWLAHKNDRLQIHKLNGIDLNPS